MSNADEEGGQSEVDIFCGGEYQFKDEIADDAEGGEGGQEAEIFMRG